MKIKHIKIDGIGGIQHLELDFQDGLNLICGTNGVGKTTILECIAHGFASAFTEILKKNVYSHIGNCHITYDEDGVRNISYDIKHYNPNEDKDYVGGQKELSNKLLFFKAQRDITFKKLASISRDTEKNTKATSDDAYIGIKWTDIKNWFIQRYMWSAHSNALKKEQISNLNKAKECFSILDKNIKFKEVVPETLDISINTLSGPVFFEFLSSGYKSCVYILLGIIKEIEYRFQNPCLKIEDFDGVILIDELDVHLHPQWQAVLVQALKKLLPKAQIIATTHSPSMIQCALPDEIIPLAFDDDNNIYKKTLDIGEYGFQGWTIEEILKYVMEVPITTSDVYNDTLKRFDEAMNNDDEENIKKYYKQLKKMLHPDNPMIKMLDIQVAGIELSE